MKDVVERVPPHNLEAEQAVLAAMLVDREAIARTMELLEPPSF
ncbi:MAG: DnaB-like helicase N-terminal domain-containing protein, partial [Candidatus Sericytochromatia bacterium]